MSAECLFCRIVAGEISADRVAETDAVLAFRDITPAAPTHILIVPKEHVEDARAVEARHGALLAEMIEVANRSASEEGIADRGYRLIFNVGPDAGQTVFHLHLHLVGGKSLGGVG